MKTSAGAPARRHVVAARLPARTLATLTTSMLVVGLGAGACGHPAEHAALDRFFAASRLRDRTALQSMATVVFEPAQQGIVREFAITRVTSAGRIGNTARENVTVSAPVQLPDGTVAPRTLLITIERGGDGPWTVTGLTVTGPAPSPPPR